MQIDTIHDKQTALNSSLEKNGMADLKKRILAAREKLANMPQIELKNRIITATGRPENLTRTETAVKAAYGRRYAAQEEKEICYDATD